MTHERSGGRLLLDTWNNICVVQNMSIKQTAVTAYFSSRQLLLFAFARQYSYVMYPIDRLVLSHNVTRRTSLFFKGERI